MRNTLGDLNNHLFAQLERIGDEELKGAKLKEEMERAESMAKVATQIIKNGRLVLDAQKVKGEFLNDNAEIPRMLGGG